MTHELREPDPQDSRQSGTDPRPSLSNAGVVDHIVRAFTAEILALVGRPDFLARLDFECRRLNGLFLGITPTDRYERSGWNSPSCLGEFLLESRHISGATHHAVRDFLMVFVAELLDVADPDAGFDGTVLESLIASVRDSLVGLEGTTPLWRLCKF